MALHIHIHRKTKDAVVIGTPNIVGDFTIKVNGKIFNCTFDGKVYRSGMMRSKTAQGLADLISKTVKDATNHLGEKRYNTYAAWRAACKAANSSVVFEGNKDICNAKPGVGEWDGESGVVYNKTKDANWSARHVGNFRFEVTTPEGKKIEIAKANTSEEAIAKAKKLPAGATHDAQSIAEWKNEVAKKYPGAIFRPRGADIIAVGKDGKQVGTWNTKTQVGTTE